MNSCYSWLVPDVTAAVLEYRKIATKVFREFDSVIMQNLSNILLLFCTSTCPPHHVSATQELSPQAKLLLFTAACRRGESVNKRQWKMTHKRRLCVKTAGNCKSSYRHT